LESEDHFVHVTPHPILPGLKGPDDRMFRGVEMFGRMLILRRVAATYMPTGEAETEMDPVVSDLQTVFTTGSARFDVSNLFQVSTFGHRFPLGSGTLITNIRISH
jgi:hypothetical protein